MKSEILKSFFKEYKEYLVENGRTANAADQYCTYLRKACALLELGEGFMEAITSVPSPSAQAALCEYLMAKLSNEMESTEDKALKKQISNYKFAVSALSEFVTRVEEECDTSLPSFPAVSLPFASIYDQKALIAKFNSRLGTQDRYYYDDNAAFSARVISRIATKTKRKSIYNDLILNTRFLYEADESKFFLLKDITKLAIQADGLVKIEVEEQEYDVYTKVYAEGKFVGFEPLRVPCVELISLDHVHPMHELYPHFLKEHNELRKLSDNILKHRANHMDMRIDQFATYYYNEIYPDIASADGTVIDEELLMDEICALIEKLELLIIHKSYNSSKNDHVEAENKKEGPTMKKYRYVEFTDGGFYSLDKCGRLYLVAENAEEYVQEFSLTAENMGTTRYYTTLEKIGALGWELAFVTPCGSVRANSGQMIQNAYVFRKEIV